MIFDTHVHVVVPGITRDMEPAETWRPHIHWEDDQQIIDFADKQIKPLSLGATRRDIFVQFLTESLAVTVLGMVLGSLAGMGTSVALPRLTPIMAIPSWEPFVLALAFALTVGTFSGVLPACLAARLRPAEALR